MVFSLNKTTNSWQEKDTNLKINALHTGTDLASNKLSLKGNHINNINIK